MNIQCPACGTVYDLSVDYIGKHVECQCGNKFEAIPMPTIPEPPAPPTPRPVVERTIFTSCPRCGGRFEVSASAVNQQTTCPDCRSAFIITPEPQLRRVASGQTVAPQKKKTSAGGVILHAIGIILLLFAGLIVVGTIAAGFAAQETGIIGDPTPAAVAAGILLVLGILMLKAK